MKLPSKDKILDLLRHPNALTLYRVVAVPLIVILMLFPNRINTFVAAILFSAAAITDFLDGFLARRLGLESNFGRIMDPLADKLLVSSTFIMLTALGWVPSWVVCIIVGREIAVTGLRNFIGENNKAIASSSLGKYKTGFQIAASIPLLIHYSYLGIDFHAIGYLYMWIALALTLWSGADYFIKHRHLFHS
jgi:CDP-diacylglycerol--glycerol-3-phosphate 3-phosphatidyltransferase